VYPSSIINSLQYDLVYRNDLIDDRSNILMSSKNHDKYSMENGLLNGDKFSGNI